MAAVNIKEQTNLVPSGGPAHRKMRDGLRSFLNVGDRAPMTVIALAAPAVQGIPLRSPHRHGIERDAPPAPYVEPQVGIMTGCSIKLLCNAASVALNYTSSWETASQRYEVMMTAVPSLFATHIMRHFDKQGPQALTYAPTWSYHSATSTNLGYDLASVEFMQPTATAAFETLATGSKWNVVLACRALCSREGQHLIRVNSTGNLAWRTYTPERWADLRVSALIGWCDFSERPSFKMTLESYALAWEDRPIAKLLEWRPQDTIVPADVLKQVNFGPHVTQPPPDMHVCWFEHAATWLGMEMNLAIAGTELGAENAAFTSVVRGSDDPKGRWNLARKHAAEKASTAAQIADIAAEVEASLFEQTPLFQSAMAMPLIEAVLKAAADPEDGNLDGSAVALRAMNKIIPVVKAHIETRLSCNLKALARVRATHYAEMTHVGSIAGDWSWQAAWTSSSTGAAVTVDWRVIMRSVLDAFARRADIDSLTPSDVTPPVHSSATGGNALHFVAGPNGVVYRNAYIHLVDYWRWILVRASRPETYQQATMILQSTSMSASADEVDGGHPVEGDIGMIVHEDGIQLGGLSVIDPRAPMIGLTPTLPMCGVQAGSAMGARSRDGLLTGSSRASGYAPVALHNPSATVAPPPAGACSASPAIPVTGECYVTTMPWHATIATADRALLRIRPLMYDHGAAFTHGLSAVSDIEVVADITLAMRELGFTVPPELYTQTGFAVTGSRRGVVPPGGPLGISTGRALTMRVDAGQWRIVSDPQWDTRQYEGLDPHTFGMMPPFVRDSRVRMYVGLPDPYLQPNITVRFGLHMSHSFASAAASATPATDPSGVWGLFMGYSSIYSMNGAGFSVAAFSRWVRPNTGGMVSPLITTASPALTDGNQQVAASSWNFARVRVPTSNMRTQAVDLNEAAQRVFLPDHPKAAQFVLAHGKGASQGFGRTVLVEPAFDKVLVFTVPGDSAPQLPQVLNQYPRIVRLGMEIMSTGPSIWDGEPFAQRLSMGTSATSAARARSNLRITDITNASAQMTDLTAGAAPQGSGMPPGGVGNVPILLTPTGAPATQATAAPATPGPGQVAPVVQPGTAVGGGPLGPPAPAAGAPAAPAAPQGPAPAGGAPTP